MQFPLSTIAAQFDLLGSALGILAAVGLSFVAITLIASYYRFQNIVKLAEDTQPDEMGATADEVLRVQLARYLAGCARRGTSFSMSLIRITVPGISVHMDSDVVHAIKQAARRNDVTCVFNEQTAVLLTETEPEDSESILSRITAYLLQACPGIGPDQWAVGIASYPGHGLSGKELIQVAESGLQQTSAESPIFMEEIKSEDEEDEIEEEPVEASENGQDVDENFPGDSEGEASKGWRERRKSAMLDELTGVLKPSAISAYMQRAMSEFRRKKEHVALFCVGVNNMQHIARFHGSEAADDVLVGVSRILQENLRADDLIGRHERYAFLVLAQCTLAEAEIIGKRITTLVQKAEFESEGKRLKTTITLGVAAYPEHGRNLHHLYVAGQRVLDHSRANDIRAYAVYDPEIHDKMPSKPMKSIKSIQA